MPTGALPLLLLSPFIVLFIYAGWHEMRRMRRDGHSNYGLAYDPETETTHVTLLNEGETGFDPESDDNDAETETRTDQDKDT